MPLSVGVIQCSVAICIIAVSAGCVALVCPSLCVCVIRGGR